uniref:Guanine nucleotide-binding protein-like 3 homolog n=1 Tax=Meloidogyne javanica TaxID=6303 RepID=A0A915N253_MELJA
MVSVSAYDASLPISDGNTDVTINESEVNDGEMEVDDQNKNNKFCEDKNAFVSPEVLKNTDGNSQVGKERTQCIAIFNQIKDDFTLLKAPACAGNLKAEHLPIFTFGFKDIYFRLHANSNLIGLNPLLAVVAGWPNVDIYKGAADLKNDYITKVEILSPLFDNIRNMLNNSAWGFRDYELWSQFGRSVRGSARRLVTTYNNVNMRAARNDLQKMAKYCLKKPSRRLTCKKKYKIQRKVREHSKKIKKLDKASAKKKGRKGEKSIAVPGKCPFKEDLLKEAESRREQIKDEAREKKLKVKTSLKLKKSGKQVNKEVKKSLEEFVKKAENDRELFESSHDQYLVDSLPEIVESDGKSARTYASEVRKTIENADILIEVLDARDPIGSRSPKIEKLVIDKGKRLVLLLNKIDLVPKENVKKWLLYFRNYLPTIAFKASVQEQTQKLGRFSHSNLLSASNSSKCVGADLVMKLLGNYCRVKDIKTSIRVGVIGFPNVGKSSVINSLKRKRSCQAGATPGLTRQMQEIQLDKHICLIDSPGVVLESKKNGESFDLAELALKNAVRVETLSDPCTPVKAVLRRCSVKMLMLHYNIPEFDDCDSFLALLAKRSGRMKKGGRPDLNAAAKQVLNDWNSGKLHYFTEPPEQLIVSEFQPELVSEFVKEFDLDNLEENIRVLVDSLPDQRMVSASAYDASLPISDGNMEVTTNECEVNDGEMEVDDQNKNNKFCEDKTAFVSPEVLKNTDGNAQVGKVMKQALKKRKKQRRKMALSGKDDLLLDLAKNPIFNEMPIKKNKIKIDKRFEAMLTDKRFDDRDFRISLDLARGEAPDVNSSSSEDEEDKSEISYEENTGPDLEEGVRRVEWASTRLAICNMDWSKISAEALMIVLQSLKPSSAVIHSVSVYLRTRQAIHAYELDRLRYYYAVCHCDTLETAIAIYEACDGVEYESSGVRFDLRFIPDEMDFEENRLRDRITQEEINLARFKPKNVKTHPLQCSNPKLSWEEGDLERKMKMKNAFESETKLEDFESLVAPGSDEDEETQKNRYQILISAARESAMEKGDMFSVKQFSNKEEKEETELLSDEKKMMETMRKMMIMQIGIK